MEELNAKQVKQALYSDKSCSESDNSRNEQQLHFNDDVLLNNEFHEELESVNVQSIQQAI